ncbi:MAG: 16S rRNA (cytosine(1402)-N(4))-methyltransferase RsmH [Erysipelotrichaceae bacterium]|nr:16S rRNA (cytosine(1402)-N(4))-methyltransferase RsmH [Erysipelotrichaceae bacterium]
MNHYSVMLKECIDALEIRKNGTYIDGTLGRGGHSSEILKRIPEGKLIAFDLDSEAISQSAIRLNEIGTNYVLIHDNFATAKEHLAHMGIEGADGILLDLGVSSPQFDDGTRGFSYRFDGPLDMRMNRETEFSAYDVVNHYSYEDLVRILKWYGEEPFAKQIARSIEKHRQQKPISTTFELVDVIKEALPSKVLNKKGHPAKQTFQAIRIEVNHELDSLKSALEDMMGLLHPNGVMAVITFHSLEDRMVKTMFKEKTEIVIDKRIPLKPDEIPQPEYELISKKPILPTEKELEENTRSHSAKLRVIRKRG